LALMANKDCLLNAIPPDPDRKDTTDNEVAGSHDSGCTSGCTGQAPVTVEALAAAVQALSLEDWIRLVGLVMRGTRQ